MKKIKTTADIRSVFLEYFAKYNHKIICSSSLVPLNDPTIFFTNSGMVQFKKIFTGKEECQYKRVTTIQRCMRVSGKHNDLEMVGYSNRHHTFFEMLGNFSFGDYFKEEAIHYAWEFLTKELCIDAKRLWVTVHKNDHEAANLWKKEFEASRKYAQGLSYCEDTDNFWTMGDTGPCGYCSEIYYDQGSQYDGDHSGHQNCIDTERYIEIWNLVFMQFSRDNDKQLNILPLLSIDTGMGLERIATIMQEVTDNYDIDIFVTLKTALKYLLKNYESIDIENCINSKTAIKIVIDHIRASTFLIADGVIPSNNGVGYVLRSIIRRASYYLYLLGIRKPFFFRLVEYVIELFDKVYPTINLREQHDKIQDIITYEEIKLLNTLDRGLYILNQEMLKVNNNVINGYLAFTLHDTYGFPIILTNEIAKKNGWLVNNTEFDLEMGKCRQLSHAAFNKNKIISSSVFDNFITKFIGYEIEECHTKIKALFTNDARNINNLSEGNEGIIILEHTPFYAESGGQVGDSGKIYSEDGIFIIKNTKKILSCYLHYGSIEKGQLLVKDNVIAKIDHERRKMISANHSATHLLHRCLSLIMENHIIQKGSYVDDQRLRFDFTNKDPLSKDNIIEIEKLVNDKIRSNLTINTSLQLYENIKLSKIDTLPNINYKKIVRVVSIGDFSKELCGGIHAKNTGDIGLFKITEETGIASGVRRIEAVTGSTAIKTIQHMENVMQKISQLISTNKNQLIDQLNLILKKYKMCEQTCHELNMRLVSYKTKDLISQTININGISVIATSLIDIDHTMLRHMLELLKKQLHEKTIIVLATIRDSKIYIAVGITKDLINMFSAKIIMLNINKIIDGNGGGNAELAQGTGTNIDYLQDALDKVLIWIKDKL